MVDPNTRQGKRTPVTLKIKFKSETLEQFIERYAVDVSQGGIFIRTKEPLAVGTQMRFEFQLRDASPLIAGEGTVVWTRENDPSRPAIAPGMGVRFDRLAEGSQSVLERILSEKAKQAPSRTSPATTKPPMFTDTPTRVAPLPVQDALLGAERARADSFGSEQATPLPKPMPFHSDADDFDERAFEEATKVRALDDLIAQTADDGGAAAAALRAPRADATVSDPPRTDSVAESSDRDSAPVLPSPPETSRPQPRMLDATPSPRAEAAPIPAEPAPAKTRLGMEPAKVSTSQQMPTAKAAESAKVEPAKADKPAAKAADKAAARTASAAPEPKAVRPLPPQKSSSASIVILLLLVAAAGAAAVWFFVLRDKAAESVATNRGSGSAVADLGSAAAAQADAAQAAGSGSDSVMTAEVDAGAASPTTDLVETEIQASPAAATIEVLDTDQTGPAPLKAQLEQGKAYKARVQAPGFAPIEIEVTGGERPPAVKLIAKPRRIALITDPPGATVFIDNYNTGRKTPTTIELSKAQAARKSVRVSLRQPGYKPMDRVFSANDFREDDAQLVATLNDAMTVYIPVRPPPDATPTNTGSGSGSGSATGTGANGSGSTGAGSGSTSGSGTTSGSATPPAGGGGGGGSAAPKDGPKPVTTPPTEPEPDFMKKLN